MVMFPCSPLLHYYFFNSLGGSRLELGMKLCCNGSLYYHMTEVENYFCSWVEKYGLITLYKVYLDKASHCLCLLQIAHDNLLQYGSTDLQALLQITGEGGAWSNSVLTSLLTGQPTNTEEGQNLVNLSTWDWSVVAPCHTDLVRNHLVTTFSLNPVTS